MTVLLIVCVVVVLKLRAVARTHSFVLAITVWDSERHFETKLLIEVDGDFVVTKINSPICWVWWGTVPLVAFTKPNYFLCFLSCFVNCRSWFVIPTSNVMAPRIVMWPPTGTFFEIETETEIE